MTSLLAVVLFLRKPDNLLNPQFWAEDGTFFFKQAYDSGFLRTLVMPFSGYLHTLPRLGAGLALLFPLRAAPLVYALVAFCVQMVPVVYLLGERMGRWIPDRRLRLAVALLYVLVPNSYETYLVLLSCQWNLAIAAVLILTIAPPSGRAGAVADLLLLALFAGTGPFTIFLLPCALLNLRRERHGPRRMWYAVQAAVVATGAVMQALFILFNRQPSSLAEAWPAPLELVRILSTHIVFNSLLGIRGTIACESVLALPLQAAGLVLAAALAWWVLRRGLRPLTWLLYLAGATVCSWLLWPANPIDRWRWPEFGPRYFTYATLSMLYAIALLCAQRGRLRLLGGALALPALLVGIPGDFAHFRRPDTFYPDQIGVFESLPAGRSYYLPIQPPGPYGVVLRKKPGKQKTSPLTRLRPVAGDPAWAWDENSPATITADREEPFLRFSGWAVDTQARKPAGGVWLEIDGSLFPAVYGAESRTAEQVMHDPACRASGFSRDIPESEVGHGMHRFSLIVLTHDRTGYYRLPWRYFATSPSAPAPPR